MLDGIAIAVALAVEGVEEPAIVLVGDDWTHASSDEIFTDRIAVIGLVGQKYAGWWCGVEHDGQHPDVGCLPGREREDKRPALAVAQGMDLIPTALIIDRYEPIRAFRWM